jgi:hypothetical protein
MLVTVEGMPFGSPESDGVESVGSDTIGQHKRVMVLAVCLCELDH